MSALDPAHNAKTAAPDDLPSWKLDDLYSGLDSPKYAADLEKAAQDCHAFAALYRGKLADVLAAPNGGEALYAAIRSYEQIDDLITRIMSFAGLAYSENTVDPVRAKFYGDAQEKVTTASTDLLFFALELNRLDDAALERAMAQPPLDHYRPWLEDSGRLLGTLLKNLPPIELMLTSCTAWDHVVPTVDAAQQRATEEEEHHAD